MTALAKEINSSSSGVDHLDALFVHINHFDAVFETFCKSMALRHHNTLSSSLHKSPLLQHGCSQLMANDPSIFTCEVGLAELGAPSAIEKLEAILQASKSDQSLSLIKFSTLEEVLDATGNLKQMRLGHAALLNPASKKSTEYFHTWIRASVVSSGLGSLSTSYTVPTGERSIQS